MALKHLSPKLFFLTDLFLAEALLRRNLAAHLLKDNAGVPR